MAPLSRPAFIAPTPITLSRPAATHVCISPARRPTVSKMVRVSIPVTIEAPPSLCHSLFSDLSLMSTWSQTLQSVSRDTQDPLYSTWTFSLNGIPISWRALDQPCEPLSIRWKSITGVTHTGDVSFSTSPEQPKHTKMVMTIHYDTAALLAMLMQTSFVDSLVRNAITTELNRFRSFTLRTKRKQSIQTKQ